MTTVTLGDESPGFIAKAASIADIQEAQFVGITSVMSGDERVALEVHIFEVALRGLAEGHCPSYPARTGTPVKTSGF